MIETRFEIDMDLNAQPRDWILGTYWSELGQFRIERIFVLIFIHFAITTVYFAIAIFFTSYQNFHQWKKQISYQLMWFFNFLSKTRTNALLFCKTDKSIKLTIATIFFWFTTISPKNCKALGMHPSNFSLLQWQWYANSFTGLFKEKLKLLKFHGFRTNPLFYCRFFVEFWFLWKIQMSLQNLSKPNEYHIL